MTAGDFLIALADHIRSAGDRWRGWLCINVHLRKTDFRKGSIFM